MSSPDPLAIALHEAFRTHERWAEAPPAVPASLVPWAELAPDLQRAMEAIAGQVRERLSAVGLTIEPVADGQTALSTADFEHVVEPLAKMAHLRWMNLLLVNGWHYAPGDRDAVHRRDPFLVPWEVLPWEQKERRLTETRDLPRVCTAAHLAIVRTPPPPPATSESTTAAPSPDAPRPLSREDLEILARELHTLYVTHRLDHHESLQDNPSLRPYESLPEHLRNSNREAARQLWHRLAAVGYSIVRRGAPGEPVPDDELQAKGEILAEMGHMRWVNERQANGWSWSLNAKDLQRRTHPHLVPWPQLPEEEREKNREIVRDLQGLLAHADLVVVRRTP